MNIKFEKLVSNFSRLIIKDKKRKGRGIGSGLGKTSGVGHKGQKSRAGYSRLRSFEGGQRTIITAFPQRGFNNFSRKVYDIVVLDRIAYLVDQGVINIQETVLDRDMLVDLGLIRKNSKNKIKLILGKNKDIKIPLKIKVHACSVAANQLLKDCGGECHIIA